MEGMVWLLMTVVGVVMFVIGLGVGLEDTQYYEDDSYWNDDESEEPIL